jgi:DNA-binding PadR family transcriptional regulator
MVLGLTAEEPGTVAEIQRRLSDLFPSADFPKTSAHSALPGLEAKGYVRLAKRGSKMSQNYYEATPEGLARLKEWVTSRPPVPASREAVHGKVEFATLDQLVEVIVLTRAEAKACQITSDDAHQRMLTEQRRRIAARRNGGWAEELDDELSNAHLSDVKLMWEVVADRRRKLADRLEKIYQRYAARERSARAAKSSSAARLA